jgi:GT2 family glycosyltransferase
MTLQSTLDKVLLIIVLYEKKLSTSETFLSLMKSAKRNDLKVDFYVYDNSKESMLDVPIENEYCCIKYSHDIENSGIAKAYNIAAKYALKNEYKWILTLDQDTYFSSDTLVQYAYTLENIKEKIPLIAPVLRNDAGKLLSPFGNFFGRGYHIDSIDQLTYSFRKYAAFNSGVMINLNAFFEVNGFDERLFDFSDHDFFLRLGNKYKHFLVAEINAKHDLSSSSNSGEYVLRRFEMLVISGKVMKNKHGFLHGFGVLATVYSRAIKLSLINRTLAPIRILFKYG